MNTTMTPSALILLTTLQLSDDLSAESHPILSKHLRDRLRDPRARFLFGCLATDFPSSNPQDDLIITRQGDDAKEAMSAEYKVRSWEMVQGIGGGGQGGSIAGDTSMSLSLFRGRILVGKEY